MTTSDSITGESQSSTGSELSNITVYMWLSETANPHHRCNRKNLMFFVSPPLHSATAKAFNWCWLLLCRDVCQSVRSGGGSRQELSVKYSIKNSLHSGGCSASSQPSTRGNRGTSCQMGGGQPGDLSVRGWLRAGNLWRGARTSTQTISWGESRAGQGRRRMTLSSSGGVIKSN